MMQQAGEAGFRARSRGVEWPNTELGVTLARFRSSTPKAVPPRDVLRDHQKNSSSRGEIVVRFRALPVVNAR
jgi:hypothetical protein